MPTILILPGQHVGAEILAATLPLLQKISEKYKLSLVFLKETGTLTDPEILKKAETVDAVLTGPLSPREKSTLDSLPLDLKLQPVICYEMLHEKSPLKAENCSSGFDILFCSSCRENEPGFSLAQQVTARRGGHLLTTDSSFTDPSVRQLSAEQVATQLLYNQRQFDVIYSQPQADQILATLARELTGTPQLYATGWLSATGPSVYEATALMQQLYTGKGTANPVSALLAISLLLRHTLAAPQAAEDILQAVEAIYAVGARTVDLAPNDPFVATTEEMAAMIAEAL